MLLLKTKNILLVIILYTTALLSCGGHAHNNSASGKLPVDSIGNPNIVNLSKEDYNRYHNKSKHFFDTLLKDLNGSYLVAKNGQIVLEDYKGFIDPVVKKDSITANSSFHLASVSKTFTAMAIVKLWQDARLQLNDSLSKYFPNFPYPGITIKMLLTHRSGLPNYVHYLDSNNWDKNKFVTNADVLNSLYTIHPPKQFSAGKRFTYCNTNYALLALIIEKVSGMSYADFLEENFFKPLQMNNTFVFNLKDTATAMPSFAYNNNKYQFEFLDIVYGDKNIYSNVRDMLKWDQALYAGEFFKQQSLDSAFAPHSFEKEGKRNYGFGWRMTYIDNGKKLLYHNGWWHGNNSVFIRLLDEHATIIVLGNKFNKKIYQAKRLADVFGDYHQYNELEEEGNP